MDPDWNSPVFIIRPFIPDDYPAIADLLSLAYPEFARTSEELRWADELLAARFKRQRSVAEISGRVVGFGDLRNDRFLYHPRRFFLRLVVGEPVRHQGIGPALYEHLIVCLRKLGPEMLCTWERIDRVEGLRFALARGFEERHRVWCSRLNVHRFDPRPYAGLDDALKASGIEIRTLGELEGDPERDRKLYELESELFKDVVAPFPSLAPTPEVFLRTLRSDPKILPDAYCIAVRGTEYIGQSVLWSNKSCQRLDTGLTAVKRPFRRQGIALALKLRGIAYAKAHDYPIIMTSNDSLNLPILSINERLGFVRDPAMILLAKPFK
jgi:GNAT superfamily N-acetyltransferase